MPLVIGKTHIEYRISTGNSEYRKTTIAHRISRQNQLYMVYNTEYLLLSPGKIVKSITRKRKIMITNRIMINPHNFFYLNSILYRYPSLYRYRKTKAGCSLIKGIRRSSPQTRFSRSNKKSSGKLS